MKERIKQWWSSRSDAVQIAAMIVVVIAFVAGVYGVSHIAYASQSNLHDKFRPVCDGELGESWEYDGYIYAEGMDHYDIKCIRDRGWFQGEDIRMVTVEKNTTKSGQLSLSNLSVGDQYAGSGE